MKILADLKDIDYFVQVLLGGNMSILMRIKCFFLGHNYMIIKKDDEILVRECIDCGKISKVTLVIEDF